MPDGSGKMRPLSNAIRPLDFCRTGTAATVTLADARLFAVFESGTGEVTEAVLLMTVPLVALTVAVRRIASEAPAASCEKFTLTLLPLPPHTAFPVAVHLVNDKPAGRLSVTVTGAAMGPLFLT